MNRNAMNRLNDIKWDVDCVIRDLGSIRDGLYRDFENVGNDRCAEKINGVIDRFHQVQRELNSINSDNVDEC